jgi:hypothetical protein
MRFLHVVITFIALTLHRFASGNVHTCIHASNKVRKAGDGSTEFSCMGCDPAHAECAPGCGALVKKLYRNCANVCLPDGYYFDPRSELQGCWEDEANAKEISIQVNRCGCNYASATAVINSLLVVGVTFILTSYLYFQ